MASPLQPGPDHSEPLSISARNAWYGSRPGLGGDCAEMAGRTSPDIQHKGKANDMYLSQYDILKLKPIFVKLWNQNCLAWVYNLHKREGSLEKWKH